MRLSRLGVRQRLMLGLVGFLVVLMLLLAGGAVSQLRAMSSWRTSSRSDDAVLYLDTSTQQNAALAEQLAGELQGVIAGCSLGKGAPGDSASAAVDALPAPTAESEAG